MHGRISAREFDREKFIERKFNFLERAGLCGSTADFAVSVMGHIIYYENSDFWQHFDF